MDLVKISNILNALVQLHPTLKYYHCGIHSKVNQSGIPNNFDPLNSVGVQYPFLLFPYPVMDAAKELTTQKQTNNLTLELDFYDTMFYNDDSTNNTRTELEIMRDLDVVANDILTAFQTAAKVEVSANKCNWLGIQGPIKYEYIPFAHNNRLACIRCIFAVAFSVPCSTFTPNFSLLPVDTPVPVLDYDYEDLAHKTDSP